MAKKYDYSKDLDDLIGSRPADKGQTSDTPEAADRHTNDTPSADKMERHNLWVPAAHWEELKRIAARDHRKVSEVVREAIRLYLGRR